MSSTNAASSAAKAAAASAVVASTAAEYAVEVIADVAESAASAAETALRPLVDEAATSAALAKSVAEIDTSDALVATLAGDPASETGQVLSATYAGRRYALAPESPAPKPPTGRLLSRFQPDDVWSNAAGGWSAKTDIVLHGTQSWGFTSTATAGENHVTRLEFPSPVDARDKTLLVTVYISDPTKVTLFQMSMDSGASGTSNTMNYAAHSMRAADGGQWITFASPYGSAVDQTGTPNRSAMRRAGIRVVTSGVIEFRVNSMQLVSANDTIPAYPNGVIILESDDGAGTNALMHEVLSEYGIPGTINMIAENADQPDRLSLAQLKRWQAQDGWDVQAHAYHLTTQNFLDLTADELDDELAALKDWMRVNGFHGEFVAYPQGGFNATVQDVASRYFRGGRTVYRTPLTAPGIRPYAMAGWSVDNTDSVATITGYMDLCASSGIPAHIVFHHWEDAGDITAADPKGWTTGRLRSIIEHGLAQGYTFATYSDVYGNKPTTSQVQSVPVFPDTDGRWKPRDSGFVGCSMDPALISSNYTLVSGTQYVSRVKIDRNGPIAGVRFYPTTAGTGITEATCDVFDSTGALLCSTSIAAALASASLANVAFASPGADRIVGDHVYVGIRATFTGTAPAVKGLSTAAIPNINASGPAIRYATAGTGITSPLTSLNPTSGLTPTNIGGASLWVGLV